ncbi:MAG: ribosome silencing factor [Solirubrobacterales bacterium]|nr:ribosome silencing factor [Solirubrobacterales bacterium]
MAMDSQELTGRVAALAAGKLAGNIVALDMRELVSYTDSLIICTARNERQAEAIADEVHLRMKQDHSLLPVNPDRSGDVAWTVLDYLDCVLHIFTPEARERYDLEELWHEAPRIELDLGAPDGESASAA